jgi:hypothetical protein
MDKMKLNSILKKMFFSSLFFTGVVYAQPSVIKNVEEIVPRPSTLQKILLESESFPKKETVMKAYANIPFPSQYIDFDFADKSFNPKSIKITNEDRALAGKSQSKLGSLAKSAAGNATGGLVDSTAADIPLQIEKYLNQNQIAKKIASKWLDIKDGRAQLGNYMMKRALDGISENEKNSIDMDTYKANLLLTDVEIMSNSFVIFNKLFFQENEPVARVARDLAILQAQKISVPVLQEKAIQAAQLIYEKVKEGYTVFATSYLYKLDWDIEKAKLANDYFNNPSIKDPKIVFDTTNLFKMMYLGKETSTAFVGFSLKEKRTEEQIIELAVKRALNNSMSKLQRNFEAFRPIYRLDAVDPPIAAIGLKEGILPGDKFEVLKPVNGKVPGTKVWKKAAKIKVDKNAVIWDNLDDQPKLDSLGNEIILPKYTPFKGKVKNETRYFRIVG